jgi:hypothetical protein
MTATASTSRSGADDPSTEQIWREFGTQLQAFVRRRVNNTCLLETRPRRAATRGRQAQ